jgi:hypothetical protein
MSKFVDHYRGIFRNFGYPLTKKTGVAPRVIEATEKRLGVRLPTALRDYYLVAGAERRFNTCFQRLLAPANLWLDHRRLVFMEENQSVVFWGVAASRTKQTDPTVFQGINDEPISWYVENRKCSVFLSVILHYQAVSGLPHCARADAPDRTNHRFRKHGRTFYGEDSGLKAYSRPNQVVCLMPGDRPWMQKWSVLAAAKTKRDLEAIGAELGVEFR